MPLHEGQDQYSKSMRFGKTSLLLFCCASCCALTLAGCGQPEDDATRTTSATDQVPTSINITCKDFNAMSDAEQKTATDKLLHSYQEASNLASDQAQARRDLHLAEENGKGTGAGQPVEMESPSFLNLARHTCELPRNRDVRLLSAMGFS